MMMQRLCRRVSHKPRTRSLCVRRGQGDLRCTAIVKQACSVQNGEEGSQTSRSLFGVDGPAGPSATTSRRFVATRLCKHLFPHRLLDWTRDSGGYVVIHIVAVAVSAAGLLRLERRTDLRLDSRQYACLVLRHTSFPS
jgi:hypothetical protein